MNTLSVRTPLVVAALGLLASVAVVLLMTRGDSAPPAPDTVESRAPASGDVAPVRAVTPDPRRTSIGDAVRAGWYSAPVGSGFSYSFAMIGELAVRDAEGQILSAAGGRTAIVGTLGLVVLDRRGDELIAGLSIESRELCVARADSGADALRDLLAAGIELRMTAGGEVTGLRFSRPSISDDRNLVRGLVTAMRFVVAPDAERDWESQEDDLTGSARVRYALRVACGDADVRRQLLGYACATSDAAAEASGDVAAHFSRRHGWWTSVRGGEQRTLQLPELNVTVRESWNLRIELAASTHELVEAEPERWQAAWLPLTPGETSELGAAEDESARRAAVSGLSLEDVVAIVERVVEADGCHSPAYAKALRTLADYLRFHPHTAIELGRRVGSGAYPVTTGAGMLSALGMANHAESQAALASVLDHGSSAQLREVAARCTAQITEPTDAMLDTLLRVCRDARRVGPIESAALASLGVLAAATKPSETMAIAARHLASTDPAARFAAVGTLQNIGDVDATALLRRTALRDATSPVRMRALEVIAARGEADARAVLLSAAAHDSDPEVRRLAERLLAAGS